MPLFIVRRRVDAYVSYVAEVRARNARNAAELASEDEAAYAWQEEATDEFDARLFITLDEEGFELEATEVSHL